MERLSSRTLAIIGFLVFFLLILWGFVTCSGMGWINRRPFVSPKSAAITPYETTLSGEFVCLPHRDKRAASTMECAYGIRTAGGFYYALDLGGLPQEETIRFPTSGRITVKGSVVPIEAISSNAWQKYDIVGIMHVVSTEFIDPRPSLPVSQ